MSKNVIIRSGTITLVIVVLLIITRISTYYLLKRRNNIVAEGGKIPNNSYDDNDADRNTSSGVNSCTFYLSEILDYDAESKLEFQYETLECHFEGAGTMDSSVFVELDKNDSWIKIHKHELISSRTELVFANTDAFLIHTNNKMVIQDPSKIELVIKQENNDDKNKRSMRKQRRDLLTEGEFSVLVVKVDGLDNIMSSNEEELHRRIFSTQGGMENGPLTAFTQISACSDGKLNFRPVQDVRFPNGIISVLVDEKIDSLPMRLIKDKAVDKLVALYGSDNLADYVMFCLPDGSPGYTFAAAYQNHVHSWYRGDACMNPSAVAHEIGHNIGLSHSGIRDKSNPYWKYEDQSGTLGWGVHAGNSENNPDPYRRCFNGVKNWYLKWYEDRHLDVSIGDDWFGSIIGVANYNNNNNKREDRYVLVRLCGDPILTYFISFNAALGINMGTATGPNQVLVHSAEGSLTFSYLESKLGVGEEFKITSFNGIDSVRYVTIKVISIQQATEPWYAEISLLSTEQDLNKVSSSTSSLSSLPTPKPAKNVAPVPTPSPMYPEVKPSSKESLKPIVKPSMKLTTRKPTSGPTGLRRSHKPTAPPTVAVTKTSTLDQISCNDLQHRVDGIWTKWYDKDGPGYSCNWYETNKFCSTYGGSYRNDDAHPSLTAKEACCVCGGGVSPMVTTSTTSITSCDVITDRKECQHNGCTWKKHGDICKKKKRKRKGSA